MGTQQHGSINSMEDESHLPHENSGYETLPPMHEGMFILFNEYGRKRPNPTLPDYSIVEMNYMGRVIVGRGFYGFMPLGITGVLMRTNLRKRPLSLNLFALYYLLLLVTLAS